MFLNHLSKHLKEYADKARQSAFSDTWEKELLNISAKVHVSRLEALKTQLRQQVEMLFAEQADVMQKSLGESYKSDYYHSAYEIQKGFNVGWDMPSIDQNAINTVLSKPWAPDGYNFSERIWNNKEKLLSELNTVMTQNIMTGAGPQKAIDPLAKKMNTSRSNAGRLVMTESAYFSSLGRQQCFKDLGVEKYEYVATLDRKTSETCRDLDGKVFDIDDYKPGTNAPPMHCWCRSCIVPYFDDMEMLGERAARDPETGKTILVPEDMTYREWEKKYGNTGNNSSVSEREAELEKRAIRNKPNSVNFSRIKSKEYRDIFKNIPVNEQVQAILHKKAIDILKHRAGSEYEDMYLINIDTGVVEAGQTKMEYFPGLSDEERKECVKYNTEMEKKIAKYGGQRYITIHNHPKSYPPSGSDFSAAFKYGYSGGITVGHDGTAYYYRVGEKKFSWQLFDFTVAKYYQRGYNLIEAYEAALSDFKRDYGLRWMRL